MSDFRLLEDGTSKRLLEDGTSKRLLESAGSVGMTPPDPATGVSLTDNGNGTLLVNGTLGSTGSSPILSIIATLSSGGFTAQGTSFPLTIACDAHTNVSVSVVVENTDLLSSTPTVSASITPARSVAAAFYIDPVAGDDNNSGLSALVPWKNVTRASQFAWFADASDADQIILLEATDYTGNFDLTLVGNSAKRICVGTGRMTPDTAGTAYIARSATPAHVLAGNGNAFRFNNSSNFTLDNVKLEGSGVSLVDGSTANTGCAVSLRSTQASTHLPNVRILATEQTGFQDATMPWTADDPTMKGFDGLEFRGNKVHANQRNGFVSINFDRDANPPLPTGTFPYGTFGQFKNFTIVDNEITDMAGFIGTGQPYGGVGISPYHIDTFTIRGNLTSNINPIGASSSVGGSAGIGPINCRNGVIEENEACGTHGPVDAMGIDLDVGSVNVIVRRNYSHHNDGPGFAIFAAGTGLPSNGNKIYANVSAHNLQSPGSGYTGAFFIQAIDGVAGSADAYNNTFWEPHGNAVQIAATATEAFVLKLANNVLAYTASDCIVAAAVGHPGALTLTLEGNDYFAITGTTTVLGHTSYAALQGAGKEASNKGRFGDPALLSPASAVSTPTLLANPVRTITNFDMASPGSSPLAGAGVDLATLSLVTDGIDFHRRPDTAAGVYSTGADSGSRVVVASGLTLTAPTPASGAAGAASGDFTVGVDGALTSSVSVVLSAAPGTGTFTPASPLTLTSGAPSATFKFTPSVAGSYSISVSASGLSSPTPVTYTATGAGPATALVLAGASTGSPGVAITYTVSANGSISGTVPVTPHASPATGTLSPTSVTLSAANPTRTFTFTPSVAGTYSITLTTTSSLTPPAAKPLTVTAGGGGGGGGFPTISVRLVDIRTGQPAINLTGLRWAWWDLPLVDEQTTESAKVGGSGASTDGLGMFSVVDITGTTLVAGDIGWLEVTNSDGTVTQSPVGKVAAGPVTVH